MREFCMSGSVGGRGGQLPRSTRLRHLVSYESSDTLPETPFLASSPTSRQTPFLDTLPGIQRWNCPRCGQGPSHPGDQRPSMWGPCQRKV